MRRSPAGSPRARPEAFTAVARIVFIVAAVLLLSPLVGAAGMLTLAGIWFATRWYLRRARPAYLWQGVTTSELAQELAATTAGAGPWRLSACTRSG